MAVGAGVAEAAEAAEVEEVEAEAPVEAGAEVAEVAGAEAPAGAEEPAQAEAEAEEEPEPEAESAEERVQAEAGVAAGAGRAPAEAGWTEPAAEAPGVARPAGKSTDRSRGRAAAAGYGRCGRRLACALRRGGAGRRRRWSARGSAPGAPRARSSGRRPRQPRCPLPDRACLLPSRVTHRSPPLRRGSRASGRRRPRCPRLRRGSATRSSARDPARAAGRSQAGRGGTAARARREAPVADRPDQGVFAAFGRS